MYSRLRIAVEVRVVSNRRRSERGDERDGRTSRDWREAATLRELVRAEDANKDAERHDARPPADDVADEVDLGPRDGAARPEADAAQEERPVDRTRRIRVRVGEARVVLQHEDLQLEELAQEAHLGGLARLLLRPHQVRLVCARGCVGQEVSARLRWTGRRRSMRTLVADNLVDDPVGRLVAQVLVAVDLLLLVRPVGEDRVRVGPHGDARRDMDELEVARLGHPLLALVRAVDVDAEVRVGDLGRALLLARALAVPRRELGVGREGRARDVVREERRVGHDVAERDDVVVAHDAPAACRGERACRLDDPVVVGVVERVARHLLALRRDAPVVVLERVTVRVRVQEGLGAAVLDRQRVVVADLCAKEAGSSSVGTACAVRRGLLQRERTLGESRQRAVEESLLERRAHEVVAGARVGEDGKVDPEPEEVHGRGDEDEADDAGKEVTGDVVL